MQTDHMRFVRPLVIGPEPLTTENNVFLAPMAGASELGFRKIARRLGAGLTVTELVSARGIRYGGINRKNFRYIEIDPDENPVFIQLFGFDPEDFVAACTTILEHPLLSQCAGIDINMGCPVSKVIKTGAGSALMKTPSLAAEIVRRCRPLLHAVKKPLTVKFRKGFAKTENTAAEFARYMVDAGADMLSVHGRTAAMMYAGEADWACIGEVVQAVREAGVETPVIANGDIKSMETMQAALSQTGAQGVMIGRAVQGNPWLFRTLTGGTLYTPDIDERCAIIMEHLDSLITTRSERVALPEFRKTLAWYTKGTPGAVEIRRKAVQVTTRDDVLALLAEWKTVGDEFIAEESFSDKEPSDN